MRKAYMGLAACLFTFLVSIQPSALCAPPSPAAEPAARADHAAWMTELLRLHNAERAKDHKGELKIDDKLSAAAQDYAEYLDRNGKFSHTADGKGPGSRVSAKGFRWRAVGENIAKARTQPATVVRLWMHSPGHKANILNSKFKNVGFGRSGSIWVVDFGTPR